MMRRDVLTAAIAVPALAVPAVAEAANIARDPHMAWMAEWRVQNAAYGDLLNADGDETAESQAAWDRKEEIAKLIIETPAATVAGIAAKLQWVLEDAEGDFTYGLYEVALTAACDDLANSPAEARAMVECRT